MHRSNYMVYGGVK